MYSNVIAMNQIVWFDIPENYSKKPHITKPELVVLLLIFRGLTPLGVEEVIPYFFGNHNAGCDM
jgi:hypothetical protein